VKKLDVENVVKKLGKFYSKLSSAISIVSSKLLNPAKSGVDEEGRRDFWGDCRGMGKKKSELALKKR
jgi:hypothetical protein